jgi:hypothetical protein
MDRCLCVYQDALIEVMRTWGIFADDSHARVLAAPELHDQPYRWPCDSTVAA